MTADYCCEECDGPQPRWTEHEIDRNDAAGIASRRVLAQHAGHKRASRLAGTGGVGKFIVVQVRASADRHPTSAPALTPLTV